MLGTQHTTPNTTSYSGVDLHQSKATMNLSLANATPSEHQKRCIERMLQTKKFNIVQNLLAWKIHFAFPDALPYVDITNSNESLASGLDVFAPFRLYSTFNNDHRDCLASLADVPFHTVERWIRESETSSARLQAASHDVNVHGFPGANHHPATERSDFAGPFDPYAYRQPATTLQPPNKVKVEKGYFKQDCLVCAKGFDPKSQKQLRTHLKMDKHTKEYKLDSTSDGSHDRYCCCSTIFVGKDSWADHIVECHCRSSDVLGSRPTSRTHSAASLQGVSTPESSLYTNSSSSSRRKAYSKPSIIHNGGGQIYDPNTSSSGRYAGGSSYQGTPGSGVTRNTSFSSTGSRRYSGVSDLYEGSPNAAKMSGFFESAPAPTSQPRIHLEPPYLPQTVASAISPNEQLPYAKDPSGNYLFDGSGNSLHRTFNGFLVCYGRTGLIRLVDGQPVFAYPDPGSGNIIAYHYGVDVG